MLGVVEVELVLPKRVERMERERRVVLVVEGEGRRGGICWVGGWRGEVEGDAHLDVGILTLYRKTKEDIWFSDETCREVAQSVTSTMHTQRVIQAVNMSLGRVSLSTSRSLVNSTLF